MPRTQRNDDGVTALFIVLITTALFAMAGLVIDGGYAMASNRRLTGQAEQAARIGADALNQDSLRDGGDPKVDPSKAVAAAQGYLSQVGAPRAQVDVDGGTVTVTIKSHSRTSILSAVGVTHLPTSGAASAESVNAAGLRPVPLFPRRADNSTPQPAAAAREHRSDLDDLSAANFELEAEETPARTLGGIGSLLAHVPGRSLPTFTVVHSSRGSPAA